MTKKSAQLRLDTKMCNRNYPQRLYHIMYLKPEWRSVSICSCLSEPPQVDRVLDSRSGPIAKLEWSTNNELIVTASQTGLYGNLIIWRVATGEKLRQIEWNQYSSVRLGSLSVASFHTLNNNRVLFGGMILYSLNTSTGQSVQLIDAKERFPNGFLKYP